MRLTFRRSACVALAATALVACQNDLTLPNYNDATVAGLASDPAGVQLAATGVLVSERNNYFGYIRDVSVFGREGYYYFATDGRFVTDYLIGAGSPARLSSTGFASGNWFGYFQNARNAVNLVNLAQAGALPAAQKAATRGFASTFRALDLYYALSLRDTLGIPVEILANPNDQAPFVTRTVAYTRISAILDSAKADLVTAGSADFPFVLHSGFAGFNTPSTFLTFNRAIAARVLGIRGSQACGNTCYTQALAALNESFVTAPGAAASLAALNVGAYNIYSSASGDVTNNLSSAANPNFVGHASLQSDAQLQADGTKDARILRKEGTLATPRPGNPGSSSIPATQSLIQYGSHTTPTPIIRNEELILIRAEANLQLGNPGAALIDLNNVRTVSGGLAPTATASLDELLYEREYSLFLEGFRWIDARRFGRLGSLPLDLPTHFVAKVVPIPKAECDARLVKPVGC
jgi:hypothetical protein